MKIKAIPFCAILLFASQANAQDLSRYITTRKASNISAPLKVDAMKKIVALKTVEIAAKVKGSIRMGDEITVMLELPGDSKLNVTGTTIPEWVTSGVVDVRLIVRLSRQDEFAGFDAEYVDAIPETLISRWEKGNVAKPADPPKRSTQSQPSRSGSRPGRMQGTLIFDPGVRPPAKSDPGPNVTVSAASAAALEGLPINEALPYYIEYIAKVNPKLGPKLTEQIARAIIGYSLQFDLDARLIMAIIDTESDFRPNLVSRAGAMGLGQLMPVNVGETKINSAFDPIENIYGTCFLMRRHLDLYHKKTGGDPEQTLILALAGYNAGDGNVRKHGGVPPFKETQNYVRKVTALFRQFKGE